MGNVTLKSFRVGCLADIEMRLGYLGRMGEMSVNGHMGSFPELMVHRGPIGGQQQPSHPLLPGGAGGGGPSQPQSVPNSQAGTYSWLSSQSDMQHLPMSAMSHMQMDASKNPKRESEDVDVMSSDSSSSSSSDSQ